VSGRQIGPDWPSEESSPVNRLSPYSPVPPGQSPAYTYLKQHLQPLQIFNQKILAPGQQLFKEILHFLDPSEFEDRA
jgi:hypothetical protein